MREPRERGRKVPQVCTVCRHPQLAEINKALVAGTALRNIAEHYALSATALHRHKEEHLPKLLTKAVAAEEVRQALDVVQQLRHINAATLTVLRDAKAAGEGELVLKAIDRVYRQIELQAKLLGDLDERPVVNVLVTPEWVALRAQIVQALAPFPAARQAVAGVLQC